MFYYTQRAEHSWGYNTIVAHTSKQDNVATLSVFSNSWHGTIAKLASQTIGHYFTSWQPISINIQMTTDDGIVNQTAIATRHQVNLFIKSQIHFLNNAYTNLSQIEPDIDTLCYTQNEISLNDAVDKLQQSLYKTMPAPITLYWLYAQH
jgi:hypothetical protein